MRIGIDLTALPERPVGAGRYMIHLVRALAEMAEGDDLLIFAQPHARQWIDLPSSPGLKLVLAPEMSPSRRLFWEQTSLPRLVQRAGLDLLHSPHYTRPYFLSCASVVTLHDMTFFLFPHLHTIARRFFFPIAIRLSVQRADRLIAVSESTRRDAMRILNIPPAKIFTTLLGVSPDFRKVSDPNILEAVRQRYHLPEEFILSVGTIEPRKNLLFMLNAYSSLSRKQACPPLVIVGPTGWQFGPIFQRINQDGLRGKVQLTGYISDLDLPIVYNLAKVLIYPSQYEGFGLPPLEAMACGTPVITTNVSAMPEYIDDAGILISPQDEDALIDALNEILSRPDLQQRLSCQGLARASKFTWKQTAQETLKVYHLLQTTQS
jgi:glycosyltransferase involved in cell wall biosynthesis